MRFFIILIAWFLGVTVAAQDPSSPKKVYFLACELGKTDEILALLNMGIDIQAADESGNTGIMLATINGHYPAVRLLIRNEADVNKQNAEGSTALHLATHFAHFEIAEMLLTAGADLSIKDIYGLSPTFYAAAYGDDLMLDMFIFYNGLPPETDENGRNAWLAAVWGGHLSTAKLLKDYGTDIQVLDNLNNNAYVLAADNRDKVMLDSLVVWGVNTEIKVPATTNVRISTGILFNEKDYTSQLRLYWIDKDFKGWIRLGWNQRLISVPVQYTLNEKVSYQFYENLSTFSVGLGKDMVLWQIDPFTSFFYRAGFDTHLVIRQWKGSEFSNQTNIKVSLEASLGLNLNSWNLAAGYQYMNLNPNNVSPHRFVTELSIQLNR